MGFQRRRRWQNHELEKISQAMYHARELAMGRMEEEADILRADGIVGVRLEINFGKFSHGLAEFLAVGTAVNLIRTVPMSPHGLQLAHEQGNRSHPI